MKQSGPTMFTQEQGKLRKQLQNLKSKQDKSQKHFLIPSGKVNFEIELTSDAFFHPFFRNKKRSILYFFVFVKFSTKMKKEKKVLEAF